MKFHPAGDVACITLCFIVGLAPSVGQASASAANVAETQATASNTISCEPESQYRDGACMELFGAFIQRVIPKFSISDDNGKAVLSLDVPSLSGRFFEDVTPRWGTGACSEHFSLSRNMLHASFTAAEVGEKCGMDCVRLATSSLAPSAPPLQHPSGKVLDTLRKNTGAHEEESISCYGTVSLHLFDGAIKARSWIWSNVNIAFAGRQVAFEIPSNSFGPIVFASKSFWGPSRGSQSPIATDGGALIKESVTPSSAGASTITIAPRGILKVFTQGFAEPVTPGTTLTDLAYLYVDLSLRPDFYHDGTPVWVEYKVKSAQLFETFQGDGQGQYSECDGTFKQDLQITHQRPDMVNHRIRFRIQAGTCRDCSLCVQAMVRKSDGWEKLRAATLVDILQTDQSTIPSTLQSIHMVAIFASIVACAGSSFGCYCFSRQYRKNPPTALPAQVDAGDITSRVAEAVSRGRSRAAADPDSNACEEEDFAARVARALARGSARSVVVAEADTNTVRDAEAVAEVSADADIGPETCKNSKPVKEMAFKSGGAPKPVESIDTGSTDTGVQSSESSHESAPVPGIAAKCGAIWSRTDKRARSSI